MRKVVCLLTTLFFIGAMVSPLVFADHYCGYKSCDAAYKTHRGVDLEEKYCSKVGFLLENAAELNLTDDQIEKIKSEAYTVKKGLIMKTAEIKTLVLDMKQAFEKDAIDVNAINNIINKKYDIKKQIAKDAVSAYANTKNILTQEQKAKAKELWSTCPESAQKCPTCGKAHPANPSGADDDAEEE